MKIGTIGIDTSFLISFFKGDEKAALFMKKNVKLLRLTELVVYEFLCGNLTDEQKNKFLQAIQSFTSFDFNRESAVLGSELFRIGKSRGKPIGHQDCMIAASYLSHGVYKIVTENKKHFNLIDEVEVLDY